jgi:histidine triad (HIT) family protein
VQRRDTNLVPVSDVICQIVSGELDAAVVARNEQVIAFLDHRPVFKGHVLVAPTRHVDTLLSLPSDLMVPLFTMTQRIGSVIPEALGAQGTFMAINNVVSQSIPHLHVHVVPRTKGDGLRGFFWPRTHYGAGEMEKYAQLISEALARTPHDQADLTRLGEPDPGTDS